jgi:hypothetical protein
MEVMDGGQIGGLETVNRMELHKDHACVCIDCVYVLLMIMMIESLWNCCTRPNAARGTVLTETGVVPFGVWQEEVVLDSVSHAVRVRGGSISRSLSWFCTKQIIFLLKFLQPAVAVDFMMEFGVADRRVEESGLLPDGIITQCKPLFLVISSPI